MKKLIALITLTACLLPILAQDKFDLSSEELKGRVKSVQSTTYNGHKENKTFVKDKILDNSDAQRTEKYNPQGYLMEVTFGPNGEYKRILSRDAENTLLEVTISEMNKTVKKIRYIYDSKNRCTQKQIYNNLNQGLGRTEYKYDSLNKLIVEVEFKYSFYSKLDTTMEFTFYKYKGKKLDSTVNIPSSWKYVVYTKYNDSSLPETEVTVDNKSKEEEKISYKYDYDKLGHLIKITTVYPESRGTNKKTSEDVEIFEYDEKGNWVKSFYIYRDEEALAYDADSRWEEIIEITERKFEYYK